MKQHPYIPINVEVTHHTADGGKVVKVETLDEATPIWGFMRNLGRGGKV